ncbi:MAG: hypothetical protein ABII79_05635 [bacterium]
MDKQELRKRMREILAELDWRGAGKGGSEEPETLEVAGTSGGANRWVTVRDAHKKVLASVAKNPFYSITEHTEAIGNISAWVMARVIEELTKIGFLGEPLPLSLGKRGSPRRYLKITPRGAKHIGVKFEDCRIPGKGSFEHCLYQDIVYRFLRAKGRAVLIEQTYNGKAVDVVEHLDDGKVRAYEIELRAIGHVADNIRGDLDAGCMAVIVVTRNRSEEKRISLAVYGRLSAEMLEHVSFRTIGEFVQ